MCVTFKLCLDCYYLMLEVYAIVLEENTASLFRFNQPPPWKHENFNFSVRHRVFILSLITHSSCCLSKH